MRKLLVSIGSFLRGTKALTMGPLPLKYQAKPIALYLEIVSFSLQKVPLILVLVIAYCTIFQSELVNWKFALTYVHCSFT